MRGAGCPIIIENSSFSTDFHCWFGGGRARAALESLRIQCVPSFSWFVWWGGGHGGPRIIENAMISMHLHGLFCGVRGAGNTIIIEHALMSVHLHGLFGKVGGGARIIENISISIHFHRLFGRVGSRVAPESLKLY